MTSVWSSCLRLLSDAMEDPVQKATSEGFVDLAASDPAFPRVSSYVYFVSEKLSKHAFSDHRG